MYRLLIVDDEEMIVDWLYELFHSVNHLDLDIYKAYSGDEALDLLNKAKIDVILSDIKMPGMDGLELLRRVRSNWPSCRVIFLTGHHEFDYVYTAIQNEAVSYLLKTEEDETIIQVVENSIMDIENELKLERLIHVAQSQIQKSLPLLQKEYLLDCLKGEEMTSEQRIQQFNELEIPLKGSIPVLLLVGRIDENKKNGTHKSFYRINALVEQHLSSSVTHIQINVGNSNLLWFIQPKWYLAEAQQDHILIWNKTILFVNGMLESIQNSTIRMLDTTLSFVMDNEAVKWESISERFNELQLLMNCHIGIGQGMIVTRKSTFLEQTKDANQFEGMIVQVRLQLQRLGKMESLLECGHRNDYFEMLSNFLACLKRVSNIKTDSAYEMYYNISLMILSYINRRNLSGELEDSIGLVKLTRADAHRTWGEACDFIQELSNILFQLQIKEQSDRTDEAISRVKNYINTHLNEDISIITLSQVVHYNPSYLSRVFKQVMGTNLSDFIAEAKLNKARELLEKTEMKIYEIADSVGFHSQSYFIRFFKKSAGMTPQEYRLDVNRRL